MTLVTINSRDIAGRRFQHGEELPPDFRTRHDVDKMLDARQLAEYHPSVRRSLYRLFSHFSGCTGTEQLTREELTAYALPQ